MISVLIPVFNKNVRALVNSLHTQLNAAGITGEIIVMDDGSADASIKAANAQLPAAFSTVRYIPLAANIGRNLIREKLAAAAAYDQLIFLDADSGLPDENWLKRYLDCIKKDAVITGGRIYHNKPDGVTPLHFIYGKEREQKTASQRNLHPYHSFMTCNFMASKQQLSQLIVDYHLQGYGHEDTFMGLQFKKLGIVIMHIDNPVIHEDIDDDFVFIKKQEEALKNLYYLYKTYGSRFDFENSIRLMRIYTKMKRVAGGTFLLKKIAGKEMYFRKKTLRTHGLFWLDCWKLAAFQQLALRNNTN